MRNIKFSKKIIIATTSDMKLAMNEKVVLKFNYSISQPLKTKERP